MSRLIAAWFDSPAFNTYKPSELSDLVSLVLGHECVRKQRFRKGKKENILACKAKRMQAQKSFVSSDTWGTISASVNRQRINLLPHFNTKWQNVLSLWHRESLTTITTTMKIHADDKHEWTKDSVHMRFRIFLISSKAWAPQKTSNWPKKIQMWSRHMSRACEIKTLRGLMAQTTIKPMLWLIGVQIKDYGEFQILKWSRTWHFLVLRIWITLFTWFSFFFFLSDYSLNLALCEMKYRRFSANNLPNIPLRSDNW